MNKEEVLLRCTQSRKAMRDTLDTLGEDDFIHPQVEGVWTIKDLLGHLTSWENTCLIPLKLMVNGGSFQAEIIADHDAWNAEQATRKSKLPIKNIIEEWESVHNELDKTFNQLSDEQRIQVFSLPWGDQGNALDMLSGLAWHEEEHLKAVNAWLEKKT